MQWIERCLGSVAGKSPEISVTVVDNGSTDGTVEFVRERFPNVRLVCASSNLGFAQGNNIGIRQAIDEGADYIYLLNQDAWVEADTIETLVTIHRRNPEYGVLSPMHYNGRKTALDRNFARECQSNPRLLYDLEAGKTDDIYLMSFVMAAHWLITRPCLLTVGEFSPLFRLYGEDNNYLHRVHYHGFKVGICPSAAAIHDRAERPGFSAERQHGFYYHAQFLQRVHNINRPLFTRYPFYFGRMACKAIAWWVQDRSFSPLRYIAHGISVLPRLYKRRRQDKRPFLTAGDTPLK